LLKLYGIRGRVTAGVAAIAGALTAATEAAHQANLISIVPDKYRWILPTVSIVALFLTVFSERVQGGASNPQVRIEAQKSDIKNELEATNSNPVKDKLV
jgi:hypothetical protein